MKLKFEVFCALIVPVLYLFIALLTITHYGVSIDDPPHFRRGQGYLHFFLTGKKDYKDLSITAKRSAYQDDNETGGFYIDVPKDQSHPPLNDTLAAFTNYIFYQKLGILGDVESHNLFGILSVTLLILGVYIFTRINFGIFPALIASLSLFLYPIFLAESHFNVKDPPEASFFSLTIILFWLGITKKKAKYIYMSAVSCAIALGTKFNVLFLPFILLPWVFSLGKTILKNEKKVYIAIILFPLIVVGLFFVYNPNLWIDPITRVGNMINFYVSSGTLAGGSSNYQPEYLIYGFNFYPLLAVIYSTPLIILFFSLIGLLISFWNIKKSTYLLIIVWFIFPILRASMPGATIYGGIRHIFEFLPAMAILSGIGAQFLVNYLCKYLIKLKKLPVYIPVQKVLVFQIIAFLTFVPIILKIISIHPNENVYYNPLIGGLKGAYEKNFPTVGNSLGNTYLQGAMWLNTHAEKKSCVTTPLANSGNIPPKSLKTDIEFHNTCQSGKNRLGEYAMDMVYKDYFNDWYAYAYYPTYLYPVHQITVDGVAIFEIYKNDLAHSKKELIRESQIIPTKVVQKNNEIKIDLPKAVFLSGVSFSYDVGSSCHLISDGYMLLSANGEDWKREPDNITVSHGKRNFDPKDKQIQRSIAAKKARYIIFVTNLDPQCIIDIQDLKVLFHPDKL